MTRILLADDDAGLVASLKRHLEREGFAVGTAHDGPSAVDEALSKSYAAAVIDEVMPGISGIEVLMRIRARSRTALLMLTARDDETDRIVGLEIGADDCISKPCSARELTARIRAVLRRAAASSGSMPPEEAITTGSLVLWPRRRMARWRGHPLAFTGTEFRLIETLARHAGRPVSKQDLSESALGRPLTATDRSVDVHVASIRRKLTALAGDSCIRTVHRHGYQLVAA